jgi:hypothetical protein
MYFIIGKIMNERLNFLIDVLLDSNATVSERDDAAMDLFEYDNNDALTALIKVAKNKDEDPIILNSCGESIGSIWVKSNNFDINCYDNLTKQAQVGINIVLRSDRPEWLKMIDKHK